MAPKNKSSVLNPIQFFETFFANDVEIKKLKEDYFFDIHGYSWEPSEKGKTEIDEKDLEEKVACLKEIKVESNDSNPEHPTDSPKEVEWELKILYFKDHLHSTLKNEFNISTKYINKYFTSKDATIENSKIQVSLWLERLKSMLYKITANKELRKYKENYIPPKALIRYLYDNYSIFCPELTKDVHFLILDVNNELTDFEVVKIFSNAFYEAISKIFNKDEPILSDMNRVTEKLKAIQFYKDGRGLQPLDFTWPITASCYLVRQIQRHSATNLNIPDLLESGKITFKGRQLKSTAFDKNVKCFNPNSSDLTREISWVLKNPKSYE